MRASILDVLIERSILDCLKEKKVFYILLLIYKILKTVEIQRYQS